MYAHVKNPREAAIRYRANALRLHLWCHVRICLDTFLQDPSTLTTARLR